MAYNATSTIYFFIKNLGSILDVDIVTGKDPYKVIFKTTRIGCYFFLTLSRHSQADPGTLQNYFLIEILFKVATIIKYISSCSQVFYEIVVLKNSQKNTCVVL